MINKIITIILGSLSLMSCNFLDFDESTGMGKDEAYSYIDNLNDLVYGVYNEIPTHFSPIDGAMRESATDNSIYTWDNNDIYDMYEGTWSPINTLDTRWSFNYDAIRKANSFLENYSKERIERFKWTPGYDDMVKYLDNTVLELHVLRAFFHFELVMRYGSIPLVTRTYGVDEVNDIIPSNFHEIISHIVSECDTYGTLLPKDYSDEGNGGQTGRATKGFAMALKAKALLYAASPLHNPDGDDVAKWELAAKASNDIIASGMYRLPKLNVDGLYHIDGEYYVLDSPQMIFERRGGSSSSFEERNLPYGFEGATGGNTPTQNFVDAFEMKDGTQFVWGEDDQEMYYDSEGEQTRDPRLYLNVICNGTKYLENNEDIEVQTFEGGLHRVKRGDGYTKTGYYLRKLMNQTVNLDPSNKVKKMHHYVLFRYAEVLLNYAEAMVEWHGDVDTKPTGYKYSALEAINIVRVAADMPLVSSSDKATFIKRLRNERRIELAFENHRFWDIRRWKIGNDDVINKIYGVKIVVSAGVTTYTRELIQTRKWDNRMNLYPIPESELALNRNLVQNAGW